jgi:phosphoglycolate phosphatase
LKLLLFDIDGTLIHSGGAGKKAMNAAFEKVFGIPNALDRLPLAGRTDLAIISHAIQEFELSHNHNDLERFKECYFEFIKVEINQPNPEKRVMPGVPDLLNELKNIRDVYLALLTGNWEYSGRVKLARFGLSKYFDFGAFADDSILREELLPFAVKRFERKYEFRPTEKDIFVIGDTFADIDCAHAHQAVAVAVETGPYSVAELQNHKADFVFKDLSNTEEVLRVIG